MNILDKKTYFRGNSKDSIIKLVGIDTLLEFISIYNSGEFSDLFFILDRLGVKHRDGSDVDWNSDELIDFGTGNMYFYSLTYLMGEFPLLLPLRTDGANYVDPETDTLKFIPVDWFTKDDINHFECDNYQIIKGLNNYMVINPPEPKVPIVTGLLESLNFNVNNWFVLNNMTINNEPLIYVVYTGKPILEDIMQVYAVLSALMD